MGDLNRADGTRIAVRRFAGAGPTIVFLPGYASDMAGAKTAALSDWAERNCRAFVRFDYGGCGESGGAFADQTLHDWLGDALRVIDAIAGRLVLVGSSMGGWIMLLAALARPGRVVGLVGIAAAPDFTEWGFTGEQKAGFVRGEDLIEPSLYGPPMLTTARFWASGQVLLLPTEIAIDAPVRLLQGQCDGDVPWALSIDIVARVRSADVQTLLVKDGDHRLSRPHDIGLLIATVEKLLELL